ncbi:MAG: hypothetical protein HYY86_00955 [Candidatus Harrisonbacteria bacterium]|nr:hypothetical protein [Candidatus Harrisonbacteria bacterium]
MIKKLLLILLAVAVLGVAGWYFSPKRGSALVPEIKLPENLSTASKIEEKPPVEEIVKKDNKEVLRAMAAEIISRPVMVSAPLAEIDRKRAEAKIKEISDLIRSDYDTIYAWYDLGAYRRVIGDYSGAAEAWAFGALIRPKDYIGYHNLGDLYGFYIKDYPKSEENYLKSIQNNPQNIQAYLDLATIYESVYKEKSNQTESILLQGLMANPDNLRLKSALEDYISK